MTYARLFWESLRLSLMHHCRYPVEWLSNYVGSLLFFGALLLGTRAALEVEVAQKASALLFILVPGSALQAPLKFLEGKASQVEEIYLYPLSAPAVLVVYGLGFSATTLLNMLCLYLGLALVLALPASALARIMCFILPAYISMLGVGLVLAGLQILLKRLGGLPNLISLLLFAAAFSPPGPLQVLRKFVPVAQGFLGVQGHAVGHWALWIGAGAYLVVGWTTFAMCEKLMTRWGVASTQ